MYAESDDTKTFSMHDPPLTANNTGMLSKIAKLTQEAQNESNRYCTQNRRSRQSRHSEGDPSLRTLTQEIVFCSGMQEIVGRGYIG
jgi:hypothetical protein